MLSALRLTNLTCLAMSDGMHLDGSLDDVKKKQKKKHTFSSTELLSRVNVADKLVLVNPF